MPKFSIITVSYNAEKTIASTLKSINSQKHDDYEVIVIDGKSNDNTIPIIQKYATEKYLIISETDNGLYDAMNKGLSLASGDIIHFLNADDTFSGATVLTDVATSFAEASCGIVYSSIRYVNSLGEELDIWECDEYYPGKIASGFHVPHPGFFAKKCLFDQLGGFDTSMKIAADFDLMARFFELGHVKAKRLNQVTVNMFASGTSSKIRNIVMGFWEIQHSLRKLGIRVQLINFILARYLPKIRRKLLTLRRINWDGKL